MAYSPWRSMCATLERRADIVSFGATGFSDRGSRAAANFFFQAEDGIRDYKVTGVQTVLFRSWVGVGSALGGLSSDGIGSIRPSCGSTRSEERRVGKECRSRWSPYH